MITVEDKLNEILARVEKEVRFTLHRHRKKVVCSGDDLLHAVARLVVASPHHLRMVMQRGPRLAAIAHFTHDCMDESPREAR